MEAILQALLADSHGLAAYLTVFGILVVCGLGVPLPEDISLILGGYLAYQGSADLTVMMAVGFLGILVGDSLIYLVGRRLGERPHSGWLGRIITPEKRAVVASMFEKHGRKVVMIARFMPGVRAVTYFTAGSVKMNYFQFIFWDGLAAIVSAPLFIYLGYRFGDEMDALMAKVKEGQFAVLAVLAVVGIGAWLYHRRRKARLAAECEAAAIEAGDAHAEAPIATDLQPEHQQLAVGMGAEEAVASSERASVDRQHPEANGIAGLHPHADVHVVDGSTPRADELGRSVLVANALHVEVPEPTPVITGENELRPGS